MSPAPQSPSATAAEREEQPPHARPGTAFRQLRDRVAPLEAAAVAHRDYVQALADRCHAGWGGDAEANGRRPSVSPAVRRRRRLYTAAEEERAVAAGAAAIAGWYDLLTGWKMGSEAEGAARHVLIAGSDWLRPGDPPVVALLADAAGVAELRRAFYETADRRALAGRLAAAGAFFEAGAAAAREDHWELFQAAMTMPRRGTFRPSARRPPSGLVRHLALLREAWA